MNCYSEQQFCLRWHNYQSSLLASLPQLLDGDDLTDVTLSAGGRSIKAHRIVLSACSQYFKDIFKELNGSQHPVIVLPGVEFTDLCSLVTFMYSGEVNIYQHQLPSLIALAETLHIRGLSQFTPGPGEDVTTRMSGKRQKLESPINNGGGVSKKSSSGKCRGSKSAKSATTPTPVKVEDVKEEVDNLTEEVGDENMAVDEAVAQDLSNKKLPVQSTPSPTPQPQGSGSKLYAMCFVCGKQLSNQYNLRVHMETHQNAHYACSSCNHVSRSRDALRKHVSYRHPPSLSASTPQLSEETSSAQGVANT